MNALAEWTSAVRGCACAPCRQLAAAFVETEEPDPSAQARARREWHLDETEVVLLSCASRGDSNVEIGKALAYSASTVRNKLSVIYTKLGVSGRTAAALRASQLGLVA